MVVNAPLVGYFGVDGNQLAETADHVTVVMAMDWGDWDTDRQAIGQRIIAQLQEAQGRGIQKAIVAVGFLVFDNAYRYRGTADLVAFRQQVESLGLEPMVVATYPVDEPELHAIAGLDAVYQAVKVAWPVPLAVIYGDHGSYPGAGSADWIGFDDYPRATITGGPALRSDQKRILVPGGANPWRNDPTPFMARARSDAQVAAVIAFCWFDGAWQGPQQGIRSNGMADTYRRAFKP